MRGCLRLTLAPLLLVLLAAAFLSFTAPGRTAVATLLFLPQVFPQTGPTPIELVTDPPTREEVVFGPDAHQADIYYPPIPGPHGAVILYLGIQPIERRDPTIVQLSEGLARLGLIVLVPELPELYSGQLSAEETEALVQAVEYLRGHPDVDAERIGLTGFSAGAGLVLLAAEDPRIADAVDWINAFGGYYDATDLVRQVLAHDIILADGTRRVWIPDELTVNVVRRQLISALPDRDDRVILTNAFFGNGPISSDNLAGLSDDARLLYRLLTAETPGEVQALLPLLPERVQQAIEEVSPAPNIDQLEAYAFVMHDRDDPYIPVVQSRELAEALPPDQVTYTEFALFQHVEPRQSLDPLRFGVEAAKLFGHLYAVLFRALNP